jgi:hypothetical protein
MYIVLHAKCLLLLSHSNETWILTTDCRTKTQNIKFHENPSSGSRVVLCGRTDGRTDTKMLIVVFRNFANANENVCYIKQTESLDHIRRQSVTSGHRAVSETWISYKSPVDGDEFQTPRLESMLSLLLTSSGGTSSQNATFVEFPNLCWPHRQYSVPHTTSRQITCQTDWP